MKWYQIGICLFIIVISIPAAAIPILSVQPSISTVCIGDVFGVEIVIDDVDDLFAVDIDVIYDTSVMDLISFAPGSF